jgi:Flp pilus assembly pilin Flp
VRSSFRRFWREQLGADIPEYALLVALLAVGILAAIYAYGHANSNSFSGATSGLNAAAPTSAGGGGGGGAGGQGSDGGSGSGQGGSGGSGSGQSGDGGSGGSSGGGSGGSGGSGGGGGTLPNNPTPLEPHHGSGSGSSGGGSSQ